MNTEVPKEVINLSKDLKQIKGVSDACGYLQEEEVGSPRALARVESVPV